jgi:hypothetical protein
MGSKGVESVDPESSGVVVGAADPRRPRPGLSDPDDRQSAVEDLDAGRVGTPGEDDAPDPESAGTIRGSDD